MAVGGGSFSGHIQIRSDDNRRASARDIQNDGSGIYFLSGDSGYVWSQFAETVKIRTGLQLDRMVHSLSRHGGGIWGVGSRDPFPDGIY